jgi:hypothetical protein
VVGGFGTYLTYSHDLIAINADGVFEAVAVPKLK